MDTNESLLISDSKNPRLLVKKNRNIALVLVFVIIVVSLAFIWTKVNQPSIPKEELSDEIKEQFEAAARMHSLYKNEGIPALQAGNDSLNYGLNADNSDAPLNGLLMFSANKVGVIGNIQTFALDVSTATKNPEVYIPEHSVSAMIEFRDSSIPKELFFLSSSNTEQDGLSVQSYNSSTKKLKSYLSTKGQNERMFEWSEKAGLLAFNRQNINAPDFLDMLSIENWEIAIINPDTDVLIDTVKNAYNPQWSPDGKELLFLKKDGLYLYNLSLRTQVKVISTSGGEVIATSMINLSNEGTHLVWTTAKSGLITMSEITSWSPFVIVELGYIQASETEFYWPIFSPSGDYYAVQAIDTLKEGSFVRENSRIEIRATEGKTVQYVHKMDDFAFNGLFTDDWIVN